MSDLISRADVLEGLKHSTAYLHDDIYTIVNRIPSAETIGELDDAIAKYVADGYMLPPSGDYISRADAIEAICHNCAYYTDAQCKTDSGYWCESGAMIREDIPSAEAESDDLIIKGAKGIKDGLYNIKDGKLFQYKAKGGTVRTYQIVPSADAVQGEWCNRNSDGTWATVDFAYCSECKQPIIHKHASPLWRFCPNCGARMKGGDE